MKVTLRNVEADQDEQAIIEHHTLTNEIRSIVRFIRSSSTIISGYDDDQMYQLAIHDIYFVESVDDKSYAYTAKKVYEIKCKLYEFVSRYEEHKFFRCSKSFVVNLLAIKHVRPILDGRLSATLLNDEEVIISRQYVGELKKRLLGESI